MKLRDGLAFLLVVAALAAGCANPTEVKDLTRELGSSKMVVDLASVLPTPWERAYVFGDYETAETMQSGLCLTWDGADLASSFTKNDGMYVLVLVHDRSVVNWMTINALPNPQPAVAFTEEPPFFLERADAQLRVSAGPAGSLDLEPIMPNVPSC